MEICDNYSDHGDSSINQDMLSNVLSQNLLIDILRRLAEKDLYKCKSVSKKLYDFITFTVVPFLLSQTPLTCPNGLFSSIFPLDNPQSKKTYLPKVGWFSPPNLVNEYFHKLAYSSYKHFLLAEGWSTDRSAKSHFIGRRVSSLLPFKHRARDLLDVCNGLLLFAKPPTCRLYVCNPTTKQCISIPKLCDHRPCISRFAMLAFDPSVSCQYKIVRVPLFEQDTFSLDLDIFSSETGIWVRRTVQLNQNNNLHGFSLVKNSAYHDGILYRLLSFNSRKLVAIDLNDVNCVNVQVIDLPVIDKPTVPGCIGISKGRLSYAHRELHSFYLWHLEEAANWILDYAFPTSQFKKLLVRYQVRCQRTSWLSPYAIHPDDDIVFVGIQGLIFALYLKTGALYYACCTNALTLVPGILHPVFVYISCAIPLKNFWPKTTQKLLCSGSSGSTEEVSITDICSDESECCGNLREMDKDINGLSPEFWHRPTSRKY